MDYPEKLKKAVEGARSCLCVGLDPHPDRIPSPFRERYSDPAERAGRFLKRVIELTFPYCAAYKPNLAFFEALGAGGLETFRAVLEAIPNDKIVIADAKRGDIGSTSVQYAEAYFKTFAVDALTFNPLMGFETLEAFESYPSRALYVLALTSNPGASDFFLQAIGEHDSMADYIAAGLAERAAPRKTTLGMVVGATWPGRLKPVLRNHPSSPLLLPGVGSQGGSIDELAQALEGHRGIPLVSSSRSILFPGGDPAKWEEQVIETAKSYRRQLEPLTARHV